MKYEIRNSSIVVLLSVSTDLIAALKPNDTITVHPNIFTLQGEQQYYST